MFGSQYAEYPELLIQSLQEMNSRYRNTVTSSSFLQKLQSFYIKLFGIPEIGFQVRFLYFQKAITKMGTFMPKRILDMGSGLGSYVFYLASVYPHAYIDGWDIDRRKILFSKRLKKKLRLKNTHFTLRDITEQGVNVKPYDLIVIIDVLEHVENYKNVLKIIRDVLTPNGFVYIHTPQEKQARFFSQLRSWRHHDHIRTGFHSAHFFEELSKARFTVAWKAQSFGYFGKLAWELNHLTLSRSLLLAGIIYPLLYLLALLDVRTTNKNGLGIAILVQKRQS